MSIFRVVKRRQRPRAPFQAGTPSLPSVLPCLKSDAISITRRSRAQQAKVGSERMGKKNKRAVSRGEHASRIATLAPRPPLIHTPSLTFKQFSWSVSSGPSLRPSELPRYVKPSHVDDVARANANVHNQETDEIREGSRGPSEEIGGWSGWTWEWG